MSQEKANWENLLHHQKYIHYVYNFHHMIRIMNIIIKRYTSGCKAGSFKSNTLQKISRPTCNCVCWVELLWHYWPWVQCGIKKIISWHPWHWSNQISTTSHPYPQQKMIIWFHIVKKIPVEILFMNSSCSIMSKP